MSKVRAALAGCLAIGAALMPAADGATPDQSRYAVAVHCPSHFTSGREPVLLVHGTGLTLAESWSWNYAKTLPALGYDVCTVALPGYAMGDIQTSAGYVRFAILHIAERAHRKVDVITHSQGGMEARWAVRWFPRARRDVDDLIMLASPNHGIVLGSACAAAGNCWPAVWQMAPGSHFLTALNRGDETPGDVSYTNVYSRTDELVEPSSTVPMKGAANVAIQSVCPRVVHHAGLLTDAVAWAVVADALDHPGPAEPRRLPRSVCGRLTMPGVTPQDVAVGNATLYSSAALHFAASPGVTSEPPLRRYARRGRQAETGG